MALKNNSIIIPSKYIYQYSNDKVITNEVDRVQVQQKVVVPDNHYGETVYNEDIYSGFTINSQGIQDKNAQLYSTVVDINNPVAYVYASGIYADNQYYVNTVINIPIRSDNKHIVTSLLLGLNKDGEKNIKYSCKGKINKGTTNASIIATVTTGGIAVQNWNTTLIPPINNGYNKTEETSGIFSIPAKDDYTTTNESGTISVKAEIDIPTIDNLATVTPSEVTIDNKEYLQLDIQNILCGIRITKGGGRITALPIGTDKTHLSGRIGGFHYVEYIPETVTITVYGNTIGIDLQDNTITIGSGDNVISFTGNELMQSTNTPTVQETYQKVINNWEEGKETATIRCGIEDYYNSGTYAIITILNNQSVDGEITEYYFTTPYPHIGAEYIIVGDYITINGEKVLVEESPYSFAKYSFQSRQVLANGQYFVLATPEMFISKDGEDDIPMTFHIGNDVVPYVRGANSEDKPMSQYIDGTAKHFTVVGKKMIYDGGVWQQVTLQEALPPAKIVQVEIISIMSPVITTARTVEYFDISVGDTVTYSNKTLTVTDYDDVTRVFELDGVLPNTSEDGTYWVEIKKKRRN